MGGKISRAEKIVGFFPEILKKLISPTGLKTKRAHLSLGKRFSLAENQNRNKS